MPAVESASTLFFPDRPARLVAPRERPEKMRRVPPLPVGFIATDRVFDLLAVVARIPRGVPFEPDQPVTITVDLTPAGVVTAPRDESNVALHRCHNGGGGWEARVASTTGVGLRSIGVWRPAYSQVPQR